MKTKLPSMSRLALAVIAIASLPGLAAAATVGYYEMCDGQGRAEQATAITTAGHTPVNVTLPDAAGLAGLDVFFVNNCSNSNASAEYLANLTAISNAVAGGMTLLMHDRDVDSANGYVPGSAGISFVEDFGDDDDAIDFPPGSPILVGPGGTLTNSSLDGGSSSSHGYVPVATLPAGALVLATRPTVTQAVTFAYGHGAGTVVYSTIPLDYYMAGSGSVPAFRTIYAPNIINWAAGGITFTSCAAEGFKGEKLKLCQLICEVPQPPQVIAQWIRLWTIKVGGTPPCLGGGTPTASVSLLPAPAAGSGAIPPASRGSQRSN